MSSFFPPPNLLFLQTRTLLKGTTIHPAAQSRNHPQYLPLFSFLPCSLPPSLPFLPSPPFLSTSNQLPRAEPPSLQYVSSSLLLLLWSHPHQESLVSLHSLWQRYKWLNPVVHFSSLGNRTPNFQVGIWPLGMQTIYLALPLQLVVAMTLCYKPGVPNPQVTDKYRSAAC